MEYFPIFLNVIMLIVLAVGILLTLIGLPGNFFILAAAIIYSWQEDFLHLPYAILLILTGTWLSGELLDFFVGIRGARKERASWWATVAAFVGSIAGGITGTGIMPLVGTVLGAILGGFAASYYVEYLYSNDETKAQQVAKGVVKGQLLGMLIKFTVAIIMSVIIIYKLFF